MPNTNALEAMLAARAGPPAAPPAEEAKEPDDKHAALSNLFAGRAAAAAKPAAPAAPKKTSALEAMLAKRAGPTAPSLSISFSGDEAVDQIQFDYEDAPPPPAMTPPRTPPRTPRTPGRPPLSPVPTSPSEFSRRRRRSSAAFDDVHTPLSVAAERRRSRLSEDGRASVDSADTPDSLPSPPASELSEPDFSCELEEEVEAGDARVFLEFAQDPRPRRLGGAPYPPGPLMAALNEADGADRTELLLARLADGTITEADAPDAIRLPLERPALQAAKALVPVNGCCQLCERAAAAAAAARAAAAEAAAAPDFETAEKAHDALRAADYFHGEFRRRRGLLDATFVERVCSLLKADDFARALDDQRLGLFARVMGRSSALPAAAAAAAEATSRRAALCRGLAAIIDGDLAAAHHDADLPSVVEELPFDRQEALAWRADFREQQKENLREIQRMCGMDRPPRAAETWMLLSTALRKEPPAKPPRPWGGFKDDDADDDESQSSSLPEQPTAALAGDVAALARERALRNPGLFSADGLFAPTEEPDDFEFDGYADGEPLPDFGEDPYLHVDT